MTSSIGGSCAKAKGKVLTALAFSLSLTPIPTLATPNSTDQSDLWYVQSESGWGMQLVQRGATIFATLFVYGPSGTPTWYVSTLQNSGTGLIWNGQLFATTGPWFGAVPFNPTSVGATVVGSMTWSAPFVEQGTVTYTVNGVTVVKNVVRETLVNDNYSGTFPGAIHGTTTSCFNVANNGTSEAYAALAVVQSGTSVSLGYASETGAGCTFVGTLSQFGQFGKMLGNYSCTSGEVGSFNIFEMNVGFNYLTGRFTTTSTNIGCQTSGYFGGIRHR